MTEDSTRLIARSIMWLAAAVVAATCTGCVVGSVLLSQLAVPTQEVQSDIRELRAVVDDVRERAEANWSRDSHLEYAAGIDARLEHIEAMLSTQIPEA